MNIPYDKKLHFLLNVVGAVLAMAILLQFIDFADALKITLSIVCVLAVAKEMWDYYHPLIHNCEFLDWLAGMSGGVVGCGLALLTCIAFGRGW